MEYYIHPFFTWLLNKLSNVIDISTFNVSTTNAEDAFKLYISVLHLNKDILADDIDDKLEADEILAHCTLAIQEAYKTVCKELSEEEGSLLLNRIRIENNKEDTQHMTKEKGEIEVEEIKTDEPEEGTDVSISDSAANEALQTETEEADSIGTENENISSVTEDSIYNEDIQQEVEVTNVTAEEEAPSIGTSEVSEPINGTEEEVPIPSNNTAEEVMTSSDDVEEAPHNDTPEEEAPLNNDAEEVATPSNDTVEEEVLLNNTDEEVVTTSNNITEEVPLNDTEEVVSESIIEEACEKRSLLYKEVEDEINAMLYEKLGLDEFEEHELITYIKELVRKRAHELAEDFIRKALTGDV